jgi:ABC-type transporter Mla subunit MlaD
MIRNSNRVFAVTAKRNQELVEANKALPTFERELTATSRRLSKFADNTDPVVQELIPAAKQASPTLVSIAETAPDLDKLVRAVPPLVDASEKGLPATTAFIKQVRAFLPELSSPLAQLAPVLDRANLYRNDIASFLANTAAAVGLKDLINDGSARSNVARVTNPLNPEGLSLYQNRLPTTRQNPYPLPLAGLSAATGRAVYDSRSCGGDLNFTVNGDGQIADELAKAILDRALYGGTVQSGPCVQQLRFDVDGNITRFPQVKPDPAGLRAGLPVP